MISFKEYLQEIHISQLIGNHTLEPYNFEDMHEGDLDCSTSNLVSLKGSPEIVTGDFNVSGNRLTDFVGGPIDVDGSYNASKMKTLTSLKGLPSSVSELNVSYTSISSLEHAPERIGTLNLTGCVNLTSLINVHKYLFEVETLILPDTIHEGSLGLLKLDYLENVSTSPTTQNNNLVKALKIIKSYICFSGTPLSNSKILKCRAELEREGLGAFAVL